MRQHGTFGHQKQRNVYVDRVLALTGRSTHISAHMSTHMSLHMSLRSPADLGWQKNAGGRFRENVSRLMGMAPNDVQTVIVCAIPTQAIQAAGLTESDTFTIAEDVDNLGLLIPMPLFRSTDIGRTVCIRGENVNIDGSSQIVAWGKTKHHNCAGNIKSVEVKQNGRILLEDGQVQGRQILLFAIEVELQNGGRSSRIRLCQAAMPSIHVHTSPRSTHLNRPHLYRHVGAWQMRGVVATVKAATQQSLSTRSSSYYSKTKASRKPAHG